MDVTYGAGEKILRFNYIVKLVIKRKRRRINEECRKGRYWIGQIFMLWSIFSKYIEKKKVYWSQVPVECRPDVVC